VWQSAVKNTIMTLLGSLRTSPAFDSRIVTSQRALASTMFQMEMTVPPPTPAAAFVSLISKLFPAH
jgi:hypothetical protein